MYCDNVYFKKNYEIIQVSVYSKSLFIQIYKGNKEFQPISFFKMILRLCTSQILF